MNAPKPAKPAAAIRLHAPLRDVRFRAAPTTAEWEARVRAAEQAAYQRGLADGKGAAEEQLLRQRTEAEQLQFGVLESMRRALPKVIQDSEAALVSLALEAAQKLVAGMPVSPEMIESVVREALAQAEESSEFTVHLHPEDLALLQRHQSGLLVPVPGGDQVHFHASKDVSRGGCLVYTRFGLVDAQRETKLRQLRQAIAA